MARTTGWQEPTEWSSRAALALSLFIIRASVILAPRRDRERFAREWSAEVTFASSRAQTGRGHLIRRARAALRDALTLRTRQARGERPGPLPGDKEPGPQLLEQLLQDVRFGLRSLRKSPSFAAIALLTTALGIGATTTIFSLVDGVLLKPLPYREPDRLVTIWPAQYFSSALFDRIEPALDAYDSVAAYGLGWEFNWLADDGAQRLRGPRTTAGFFDVLDVPMTLGRGFGDGDDAPGSRNIVVTERFWRERLGSRPDIIGDTLRLDGEEHTIIGVGGPALSAFHPNADVVMPWILDSASATYNSQDMKLIGRLRAGATTEAAVSELETFIDGLRVEFELSDDYGQGATVVPLRDFLVGDSRPMLLLLFGAVGLTLLIASANVANLLLARALSRQREIAVRVALGARGGRLARQVLTESTLLAALSAIPGLALAYFALQFVVSLLPADTPRLADVSIDTTAMLFSVGVALATGWIVGVIPAVQAARSDVRDALSAGGRSGSDSAGRQRLRRTVVLAEVALAVTLVAGAGLLVKSFLRVTQVDPGFQPEGLVTFSLDPARETLGSAAEGRDYYRRMHERLRAVPGVSDVSSVWKLAFTEDGGINGLWEHGHMPAPDEPMELVRWRPVTDSHFGTTGMRLQLGRAFDERDIGADPVGVISQATADALFAGRDPIGQSIVTTMERETPVRVVGVVEDLKLAGLDEASPAVVYRPYSQLDEVIDFFDFPQTRWVVVRTQAGSGAATAASLRSAVADEDPTALYADFVTMPAAISNSLAARRATMMLLALFAISAIALGAVGIYGVMAYAVRQRAKDIGIRVALGATRDRVVREVIVDAVKVAAGGVLLGLALTYAAASSVQQFLFEVDTLDPAILAAAAAAAIAIAVTASIVPAWRAAQVDPATALGSAD
ncbi:MAG: FtsX-like permease family protein [Acidobacteria bacterium]|nr:FtsX-like permease family protein [Acidobacteriota bacterium]